MVNVPKQRYLGEINKHDMEIFKEMLRSGCKVHGFRSGGGLRVVRAEYKEKLLGYGEHYQLETAIIYTCEDFLAGQREYKDMYGKIHPHYLTGITESSSQLDGWLVCGNSFDCWLEGNTVVFQLNGYTHSTIPKKAVNKLVRRGGIVFWGENGVVYKSYVSNGFFTDDTYINTIVHKNLKNKDIFLHEDSWTGRGQNLKIAIKNAFKAKPN